ncbi:MAG: phosphodiesterase [Burkholderiales bacterium]
MNQAAALTSLLLDEPRTGPRAILIALVIAVLILLCGALVYATGGIKYVFSHSMYIPILLGAHFFRIPGGVFAGAAGGLVLGPFMPFETATGEPQQLVNWLYRVGIFIAVGGLAGVAVHRMRRQMKRIAWLATHDPLSGAPNVVRLCEELKRIIQKGNPGHKVVLVVVDIENYTEILNTLGLSVGSKVSLAVIRRLRELMPSGGEPCVLAPDRIGAFLVEEESRKETVDRLVEGLRAPYATDGIAVHLDTSLGIAYFPRDGNNPEELIQRASIAMHTAAVSRRPYAVYNRAVDQTSRENLELLGSIATAIETGQFELHFQPKVRLSDRAVTGVEALVRWRHPEQGLIPPGRFIPQVERTALIYPMTAWVLQHAFATLEKWQRDGIDLSIAVNVSARNLQDPLFVGQLNELLSGSGLRPEHLELEITESAVMHDIDRAKGVLQDLSKAGVLLSIDDFGTGHSSLAYIQDLPVDIIKIDQVFVSRLDKANGGHAIVRWTSEVAKSFGRSVVAEGVENATVLEAVADLGCDYAQGYVIQRPLPDTEFLKWYQSDTDGGTWKSRVD